MRVTAWSCVHPGKFPCDAPQGCGGPFCWKALGFKEEPPLPFDNTKPSANERSCETVQMTDRELIPWTTKINPLWWLVGPDGWDVPTENNGAPYLPDVTNVWLRRFYWFVCRNPLMNFVGFVIGVEDRNYSVTGSSPVLKTTGRDCEPPQFGWRWAIIRVNRVVYLPYTSYWGTILFTAIKLEFYLGWRPASGGFGLKFVLPKDA